MQIPPMPATPRNCVVASQVRLIAVPTPLSTKMALDWQRDHANLKHHRLVPAHAPRNQLRPSAV